MFLRLRHRTVNTYPYTSLLHTAGPAYTKCLPVEKATRKAGRTSEAPGPGLDCAVLQASHSTGSPLIELGHLFQAVEEILEEIIF